MKTFIVSKDNSKSIEIIEDFKFEKGMELVIDGLKVKVVNVIYNIGKANQNIGSITSQTVYYEKE